MDDLNRLLVLHEHECEQLEKQIDAMAAAKAAGAREEREACARLIERWHPHSGARHGDFTLAEAVTSAIRARGDS